MTIIEQAPDQADILTFVDESVREIRNAGLEPRTILAGSGAYERLCGAVAERFGRKNVQVEQYQWIGIVVDPFREDEIIVLPTPKQTVEVDGERR